MTNRTVLDDSLTGSDPQLAQGRLIIALRRMVMDYPFHASLLSEGRFSVDTTIPTMAVTVRDGQIVFLFNPDFVNSCSLHELCGVLHHEINHVLFEHIFVDRAQFDDEQARTVAEEVTVNEWVREPLPGVPITLDQYPGLPPNEDTDTRYQKLRRIGRKKRLDVPKKRRSSTKNAADCTKSGGQIEPLDDHSVWSEVLCNPILGRLVVRVAVRKACEKLTAEQWSKVTPRIRERISVLAAGNNSSQREELLGDTVCNRKHIDWRKVLRRYVGQAIEDNPVFNRVPRRFPNLAGIIPGRGRKPSRPRVLAVIDTSASITSRELKAISEELGRFIRKAEIVIAECDSSIHAVYPLRGPIKKVHGRGGTDFRPPLSRDFLKAQRADLVVYFTDGAGPAPAKPPSIPVVWCLTPPGSKPARWGRVVRMAG